MLRRFYTIYLYWLFVDFCLYSSSIRWLKANRKTSLSWCVSWPPLPAGIDSFQTGLWKWSRHPPYFGEYVVCFVLLFLAHRCTIFFSRIMCWWGIWILCLSPTTNGTLPSTSKSAQYGAIVSPLFTLMCVLFPRTTR